MFTRQDIKGQKIAQTTTAKRLVASIYSLFFIISMIVMPVRARAGFFSSFTKLFTPDDAGAGAENRQEDQFSFPLLGSNRPGQSSADPADRVGADDDPPLPAMQDSALIASLNPLGTMADNGLDKIVVYTVQDGDTARGIAIKFGISLATLSWANDLKNTSAIKEGDALVILPVSGIQYEVKKGDTLDFIVRKFKPKNIDDPVEISSFKADILSFNNLAVNEGLEVGSIMVIPDGEIASVPDAPRQRKGSSAVVRGGGPDLRGYFARPVIGGRRSRGLHGYNGVDLAQSCGLPVLASADGTVIAARSSGWNGGYGDYIVLAHANGTQTLYAHLSSIFATIGQHISKNSQIGKIGSTGNSTGCHVHFEIRGAKNPF